MLSQVLIHNPYLTDYFILIYSPQSSSCSFTAPEVLLLCSHMMVTYIHPKWERLLNYGIELAFPCLLNLMSWSTKLRLDHLIAQ